MIRVRVRVGLLGMLPSLVPLGVSKLIEGGLGVGDHTHQLPSYAGGG